MSKEGAPFVYGKIAAGADFTDRELERAHLVSNFSSLINTILISPRRWGKSSLVAKAAKDAMVKNPKLRFCFIDLFNVRTEAEFYKLLAEQVIRTSSSKWDERLEDTKKFLRNILPKISISPDPAQEFSFSLDMKEIRRKPDEIINLAETISKAKKISIIVCVDEFQNLSHFDNPLAVQKKLRSHWQHHERAGYCLYGSKRHMLMDVFSNPSMPFYKFGEVIYLEKIARKYWVKFIVKRFSDTGKKISPVLAAEIAGRMENHPFYVQQLAQGCWLRSPKTCSEALLNQAFEAMLTQNGILFQSMVDRLSNTQVNFLRAMCDEVEQFSAQKTLSKYQLGSSANVSRIKEALVGKEIIETLGNQIVLLDPLFKRWLQNIYFTTVID